LDIERFEKQLDFLRVIDQAKSVFRNTVLLDGSRRENDAEHMWHMAVCAMLFQEYVDDQELDTLRTLKMCLLHDLIEIYAGDTFAYDAVGKTTQAQRECEAADRLFSLLPDDQNAEFRALWEEFEARETTEAKYANLVDAFMPLLHNYTTEGLKWRELGVKKDMVLERNANKIEPSSAEIWRYVLDMIEDAVAKGYLPEN